MPKDTILTHKEDFLTCQSLDYIFQLQKTRMSPSRAIFLKDKKGPDIENFEINLYIQ